MFRKSATGPESNGLLASAGDAPRSAKTAVTCTDGFSISLVPLGLGKPIVAFLC
jgi:hypothetical protein